MWIASLQDFGRGRLRLWSKHVGIISCRRDRHLLGKKVPTESGFFPSEGPTGDGSRGINTPEFQCFERILHRYRFFGIALCSLRTGKKGYRQDSHRVSPCRLFGRQIAQANNAEKQKSSFVVARKTKGISGTLERGRVAVVQEFFENPGSQGRNGLAARVAASSRGVCNGGTSRTVVTAKIENLSQLFLNGGSAASCQGAPWSIHNERITKEGIANA